MTTVNDIMALADVYAFHMPGGKASDDASAALRAAVESMAQELGAAKSETEAIRTLMNCYNLGGWTDSLTLLKERDTLQSKCDEQALEIERLREEWLNAGAEASVLRSKITAMESQHQLAHKTLQDVLASVNGWSNTDDLMWMQYRLPEVIASLTAAKEVTAPKVEPTDEACRLEEIMNASLLGVGAVTKMQMLSAQQAAPTAPKEPLVVPFETSLPYERNTS